MASKNQPFAAMSGDDGAAARSAPWLRLAALVGASLGLWWMVAKLGHLIVLAV